MIIKNKLSKNLNQLYFIFPTFYEKYRQTKYIDTGKMYDMTLVKYDLNGKEIDDYESSYQLVYTYMLKDKETYDELMSDPFRIKFFQEPMNIFYKNNGILRNEIVENI